MMKVTPTYYNQENIVIRQIILFLETKNYFLVSIKTMKNI